MIWNFSIERRGSTERQEAVLRRMVGSDRRYTQRRERSVHRLAVGVLATIVVAQAAIVDKLVGRRYDV